MIEAQGGDTSVFDNPAAFHKPGATQALAAWESGYIASMDTTASAGPCSAPAQAARRPENPSIPTPASIFHARRGARVEKGQPIATLYATTAAMLPEPIELLKQAITISQPPLPSLSRS